MDAAIAENRAHAGWQVASNSVYDNVREHADFIELLGNLQEGLHQPHEMLEP